jgi:L-ascorbate metabolism protein UlaG (beta-lactamase superfamily)
MSGVVAALEIFHLPGAALLDPGGKPVAFVEVFRGIRLGHSGDSGGGKAHFSRQFVDSGC